MVGCKEKVSSCDRGGIDWILRIISSQKGLLRWNRVPREVVESLSLEVFKRSMDTAVRDVV